MRDIENREDIDHFVELFYKGLLRDDLLSSIFVDIAQIDLESHLPIIADFWESILFKTNSYQRNAMLVHLQLDKKIPLTKEHFDQWIFIFNETLDMLFEGPKSNYAKERALSIATVIQIKIAQSDDLIL